MHNGGFLPIKTDLSKINGVRIVPYRDRFKIELIYTREVNDLNLVGQRVLGIDLGLINAISTSNSCGLQPFIIKGGLLKSINQFYNKYLADTKSSAKKCNDTNITRKIQRLGRVRNNKIHDFFHKTSRIVIDYCIQNNIGTIVIGYNEEWKQNVNIGKVNNQNFVSIPFRLLIHQMQYKAKLVGISVKLVSEEYTSQTCSKCGLIRKANRKYRGLYVCNNCGNVLNADTNAAFNILQKEVPKSTWIGNRGSGCRPEVLAV
jgi:putative transposase